MFRQLELEIEGAARAGWHEGNAAIIDMRASDHVLVFAHEREHGNVFRFTTDGILLHYGLSMARGDVHATTGARAACERLSLEMLETSRFAHEAVATYLSICKAPEPFHSRFIRALPDEYLAYYREIDVVLNATFESRVLRELLCWNLALVTFCSPILVQVLAAGFPEWDGFISSTDNADHRLRHILSGVASARQSGELDSKIREVVSAEAMRAGIEPIIYDAEQWVRIGSSRHKVEIALSKRLQSWMEEWSGITALKDPERRTAELRFDEILKQHGYRTRYLAERSDPLEWHAQEMEANAVADRNVVLHNSLARTLPVEPDAILSPRIFAGCDAFAVSSTDEDAGSGNWNVVGWTNAPTTTLATPAFETKVSQKAMLQWVGGLSIAATRGRDFPRLLAISTVLRDQDDFLSMMENWLAHVPTNSTSKLCWYCLGDWIHWIEFALLAPSEIIVDELQVGMLPDERAPLEDQVRVTLKFMISSVLPGIFIRYLNLASALSARIREDELRTSGRIRAATPEERQMLTGSVSWGAISVTPFRHRL